MDAKWGQKPDDLGKSGEVIHNHGQVWKQALAYEKGDGGGLPHAGREPLDS
jgi:hypothetical protein